MSNLRSLMKHFRFLAASAFLILQAALSSSFASEPRGLMHVAVSSPYNAVLNKLNLDQVKRHIIATGTRCTYVNMYNNNPCWELQNFRFYLNPDPGPDGRLQWNINCDVTRGDFNTLVVEKKNTDSGYATIDFRNEKAVHIRVPVASRPSAIGEISKVMEEAVLAALKAIDAGK
jgi:hypothetical protein